MNHTLATKLSAPLSISLLKEIRAGLSYSDPIRILRREGIESGKCTESQMVLPVIEELFPGARSEYDVEAEFRFGTEGNIWRKSKSGPGDGRDPFRVHRDHSFNSNCRVVIGCIGPAEVRTIVQMKHCLRPIPNFRNLTTVDSGRFYDITNVYHSSSPKSKKESINDQKMFVRLWIAPPNSHL